MTARDEILGRLRRRAGQAERPPVWNARRHFPDLAQAFVTALTAAGGEVYQVADLTAALERLDALLAGMGARAVAVDDAPPLSQVDLRARWPAVTVRVAGEGGDDWREFAAEADAGLSVALAALAETGTVVIHSGRGRSRLTGLLPPVHMVLVPADCLTTDIFTWAAARQGRWPAAMTLISGPSKTADIEQTMAIGVHGPGRFVAILYERP
jgi:L-lactate dehydrogenase complex protein LldG